VPNPLRAKAHPEDFKVDAAEAMRQINQQKVERIVYQIGWLMDRIGPVLTTDVENAEACKFLDRLAFMAQELVRRVSSTRFHERADLCRALLLQARKAVEEKDPQHIDLLAHLVQAERRAFGVETVTTAKRAATAS
jgi:hypothetical protein